MKTFNTISNFINYYNKKQTIPSSIEISINEGEHTFIRTSTHNINQITQRMLDNYKFVEKENYGLGIELNVHYYRYFEAKIILESYFSFYHGEDVLFISPIYFYNKFVGVEDFEHCKEAVSDSLEKWTGLKWVNINSAPRAFNDIRLKAYREAPRDLFYELPSYISGYDDEEPDPLVINFIDQQRKKKWRVDKNGDSPYFSEPIEVPDYW